MIYYKKNVRYSYEIIIQTPSLTIQLIHSFNIYIFFYIQMDNIEEIGNQMSQEQYEELSVQLRDNKVVMMKILQENPRVGVYKNQTEDDWNVFFQFYINFLQSQLGPRGQCSKAIRAELLSKQEEINQVLKPFGFSASTHIRAMNLKFKTFSPCQQYDQSLKCEQTIEKSTNTIQLLKNEQSQLSKSIRKGLINKHGEQFDISAYRKQLEDNYLTKIEQAEQELKRLKSILDGTQLYHEFILANKVMAPYFKMWNEVDSNMGKESLKTGKLFQEKVAELMIPYLLRREQKDKNWIYATKKLQIFTNLSWVPRNLGEIDIAFGYKDEKENRYFICTLIECKSRLFDLREAFKQVSLDQQEPLNKGPTFQELKLIKQLNRLKVKQKKEKKIRIKVQGQILEMHQSGISGKEEQKQQKTQIQVEKIDLNEQKRLIEYEQINEKLSKIKANRQQLVNNKKFLHTKYGEAQLVDNHHFYIVTSLPANLFLLPIQSKMKQAIQKYTKNLFSEQISKEKFYPNLKQKFQNTLSPLDWISTYEKQFHHGLQSNILVLK